jgi:hypothetical protein
LTVPFTARSELTPVSAVAAEQARQAGSTS